MADESDLSTKIVIVPGTHGLACESDMRLKPERVSYHLERESIHWVY